MVRAPGKYKQKRGGGRNFSKEMQFDRGVGEDKKREEDDEEDDEDGSGEESEEESEEESGEDEESDEPSASVSAAQPELTRAQRREMKKKQGGKEKAKAEAKAKGKKNVGEGNDDIEEEEEEEEEGGEDKGDDDFLVNPNHVQKKMTISDLNKPRELTRREREQKEKQEAAERYRKLHLQGKTEEAKNDLHRLAQIRAEREAALAKRKAEAGAKLKEVEEKKKAQLTRKK